MLPHPGQVVAGGVPGFNKDSVPPGRLVFPALYNIFCFEPGFTLFDFFFSRRFAINQKEDSIEIKAVIPNI